MHKAWNPQIAMDKVLLPTHLSRLRKTVRVPVHAANYGPRRHGVGGTASCRTSLSAES